MTTNKYITNSDLDNNTNRRDFIKTTAALGAGVWLAPSSTFASSRWINEKINFACIGVGGKGHSDSNNAGKFGNVAAICDVDENKLNEAATRFPNAVKFIDFRDMYDAMGDKFDAVTVSTPDHTHAPAAVQAMKMGKHCFCQKPLTHSIYEARLMGDIARKKNLATQMGNQGTANDNLRKAAAVIQAGTLGDVTEVHVWTNRPVWPQGVARPDWTDPVPKHLHWDLWLGTAPVRPYSVWKEKKGWGGLEAYHPFNWRGWWDFGTGALGDMACHTLNMSFMALDLRDPISVEAQASENNRDSYPSWSIIRYEFPVRGNRPALTMYWYDGGKLPAAELLGGTKPSSSGSLVIGTQGKLYSPGDNGGGYQLLGDVTEPEVKFTSSPGHFAEYARAIETGEQAVSNFPDYASPLSESVLLGNLAVWSGSKVMWDAKTLTASGSEDLSKIIKNEYREGWSL